MLRLDKTKNVASLLLLLLLIAFTTPYALAQQPSLKIHVSLIETFPNGTYNKTDAYLAYVELTLLGDNFTAKGYTNDKGFIEFTNLTLGSYLLKIKYPNAIHDPYQFYYDPDYRMTIYENVYKLARVFPGDQITIFREMWISLPGSVTFYYPKSDVNATVESYGLRYQVGKYETQLTFTPLDYSEPTYDASGRLVLYPNYTVTINLATKEEGEINFIVIDNASIRIRSESLYRVPKGALVKLFFTLHVKRLPQEKIITNIYEKLNSIERLLLEIRDLINGTVIPKLFWLGELIKKSFNETFRGYTFDRLYSKLDSVDVEVRRIRDGLFQFTGGFKNEVRALLSESLGGFMSSAYTIVGIILVSAVIVATSAFYKRAGRKERRSSSIIVTR